MSNNEKLKNKADIKLIKDNNVNNHISTNVNNHISTNVNNNINTDINNNIQTNVDNDLNANVNNDVNADVNNDVNTDVDNDLNANVSNNLNANVGNNLNAVVNNDVNTDVDNDLNAVVNNDLNADINNDLNADVGNDINTDVDNDLNADVNKIKKFVNIDNSSSTTLLNGINHIFDISVNVTVQLGKVKIKIADLLNLSSGSILILDKYIGDSLDIFVNDSLIAKGEIVVEKDKYGIRITNIMDCLNNVNYQS